MDNNDRITESPDSIMGGLQFEIGDPPSGAGLSFTGEAEIEIEIGEAPEIAEALPEDEFDLPDEKTADFLYSTQNFIIDPLQPHPTYVPRFTEASENYRIRTDLERDTAAAATPKEQPHPTAELDEASVTPHIVVAPSTSSATVLTDESITILKFEGEHETTPTPDPDAVLEEELRSAVSIALAPEPAVTADEVAPVEKEQLEDEPTPRECPTIADPTLSLVMLDYTAADDAESISSEEAPLESVGEKSCFGEFTEESQQEGIKDRFLDKLMSVKVRLIAVSVLFAIIALIQTLAMLSVDVLGFIGLGNVTYAAAVVDFQLAACAFLFALPEFIRAVKALFGGVVAPELVLLPSVLAVLFHAAVIVATGAVGYPALGAFVAIQALLAVLSSYHRCKADFISFIIISKPGIKGVLDKRLTRTLPRENIALDGAVDEYKSKTARMFRAAFISDFFTRSGKSVENSFNNIAMLAISLGVAITAGLVSFFLGGTDAAVGAGSFAFVFLVSYPAFSILVHKLPYHRAATEAQSEGGAFVGEGSIYSSADIDVVAYEDTEIFGTEDVIIRKVHLYGKAYNATKAMLEMHSIFSVVGGPLAHVFSNAVDGKGKPACAIIVEDDGISGELDGNTVSVGNLEYMVRHGIKIPEDDYKTGISSTETTKVMYGAENGEVYVKFFVRYSFSESFTMLLPYLKAESVVPLIYTRDPNITTDLVRLLTLGEDLIRVMRKYAPEKGEMKAYKKVSAAIVTSEEKKSAAINMVLLSKRYIAFQESISLSELIVTAVGAGLSVTLSLTGMLTAASTYLALVQLLGCGYIYIRAIRAFDSKKKIKDN